METPLPSALGYAVWGAAQLRKVGGRLALCDSSS
jgi:hypothetical protein